MSDNFDEILASGDDEAIAAALEEAEISGELLFGDDADEELPQEPVEAPEEKKEIEQEVVDDKASDKNDVVEGEEKAPEAKPEPSPAEEELASNVIEQDGKIYVEVSKDNAMVDSKNGKHKLPFALLDGARGEAATLKGEAVTLKAELEEQQRINAELTSTATENERVTKLYSKQLEDAGIDPKLLPEQLLKDPELASKLKEGVVDTEEVVAALAASMQQQAPEQSQAPIEEQQPDTNSFEQAFSDTANLKDWQQNDAERWEMAKLVDSQLAKDSSFDNKTPSERFLEVEKRVNSAFGDVTQTEQTPTEKVETPVSKAPAQPQKAPIPNTPTDLGHQGSDMSANSQLLDQDAATMAASMEGMTEAQIEEMLEGVSDFL